MTDDDYRALLRRVAGVDSARFLDGRGFNTVMLAFERLGFKSDFGDANLGNRVGMATPREIALIRHLWSEFTSGAGTESGLRRWLENHWNIGALKFVDADRVHKIVGALQVMVKKRKTANDAPSAPPPPASPVSG